MTHRSQIAAAVSRVTGMHWSFIASSDRRRDARRARDLCIGLARRLNAGSYPELAAWLGMKSHTTAILAGQRAEEQQREMLDMLEADLTGEDVELVQQVMRRPSAMRLMLERVRPLIAAELTQGTP